MTAAATTVEPALYCGTYAKYNDGSIAGRWMKLEEYGSAEEFLKACRELHADEPDPELMFQDCEGLPRELYGESLGQADLQKIYDWLSLDDDDRQLVEEYVEATGYGFNTLDVDKVRDKLYCVLDSSGFLSEEDAMGWYVIDEGLVEVPEHLRGYIDAEALGRDWLMDFSVSSNGYVFEA